MPEGIYVWSSIYIRIHEGADSDNPPSYINDVRTDEGNGKREVLLSVTVRKGVGKKMPRIVDVI